MDKEALIFPHKLRINGPESCPDLAIAEMMKKVDSASIIFDIDTYSRDDGYHGTIIFPDNHSLFAFNRIQTHEHYREELKSTTSTPITLRSKAWDIIKEITD